MGEAEIQRDILVWLNKNGYFAWRNNSSGIYDPVTERYRKPQAFAINGVSDVIAIGGGATHFIEVKAPNGRLNKDQELFEKSVHRAGGSYCVARSVKDVMEYLREWGQKLSKEQQPG